MGHPTPYTEHRIKKSPNLNQPLSTSQHVSLESQSFQPLSNRGRGHRLGRPPTIPACGHLPHDPGDLTVWVQLHGIPLVPPHIFLA